MTDKSDSKWNRPPTPFFARFQTRLMLLVLLVFIPALLLTIFTNISERQARKIRVEENIVAVARLVAANEENFVKNTRQLLGTLSQISFLVTNNNRFACEWHLINLRALSPDYLDFGMIESNGILFCSAAMTNGTPDLSDTAHFQRVFLEKRFSIGNFQTNILTKQRTLDFGYPIFNERGDFFRVLYASLNLSLMSQVAGDVQLPAEATLTVFDSKGNIVAQRPEPDEWVGKTLAQEPFVEKVLGDRRGIFEMRASDGIRRLFAVAPISDGREDRLFVSIHVPTDKVFADANRALLRNISVLVIVAILALLIAHFYARLSLVQPLKALLVTARQLEAGKLHARTGIDRAKGELGELGHAFDQMAATLEERQIEIDAAHSEIKRMNAELEQRVKDRTAQLEAANQEWESFSYSVSHDLRAPLRHIDGCAELLRQNTNLNLDADARHHLDVVSRSATRMNRLIEDVLHFSRIARHEMRQQDCDMNRLVQQVIEEMAMTIGDRKISWDISPLPKLSGDRALLKQVWFNLLSNAVKYTGQREHAQISIGCRPDGEFMEFFVRDNGAGFDMRYIAKLFGVFQRLHTMKEFEGTGIGLANVRRIVNRHGGKTWAEGKVNEGATFYFSLPCGKNKTTAGS